MPVESILKRLLDEAGGQRQVIIQEAQKEAEGIIREAQIQAGILYNNILASAQADYDSQRQRFIVKARLDAKRNLLETKQELIEEVLKRLRLDLKNDTFKKQQVSFDRVKEVPGELDFYLNRLRQDYEMQVARILFA
jgi:vacuolar-type H+-ATPase subunit E/Vma4